MRIREIMSIVRLRDLLITRSRHKSSGCVECLNSCRRRFLTIVWISLLSYRPWSSSSVVDPIGNWIALTNESNSGGKSWRMTEINSESSIGALALAKASLISSIRWRYKAKSPLVIVRSWDRSSWRWDCEVVESWFELGPRVLEGNLH